MNNVEVGSAIKTARCLAGLSQTELGKAVGVSQPQVSMWESGINSLSVPMLSLIADACGTTLSELTKNEAA